MSAIIAATGTVGVAGAGLGRKRKREELDIVEVSLESRYLRELGERRFQVVDLLGQHGSHHFASQVWLCRVGLLFLLWSSFSFALCVPWLFSVLAPRTAKVSCNPQR